MSTNQLPQLEMIELTIDGGVATIALNRPDKRNAVNAQMQRDLTAALKAVSRDRSVRALLVMGRGSAFCAGQDLAELSLARTQDDFRVDDFVRTTFNQLVTTIRALPIPVVAAINGIAAGAGWSIALAADIRLASDDARFTQAFTKIGLVPDTGSTWLLPELVGTARALELALTGDVIDAHKALDWGLVNRVVPAGELEQESRAFAQRLAQMPTLALGMTRRAIHRAPNVTLADALEYEAQLQQRAFQTDDHAEGVAAFLEKREPVFTGR